MYVCIYREEMDDQNAEHGKSVTYKSNSTGNYKETMKVSKTWSSAAGKTTMGRLG